MPETKLPEFPNIASLISEQYPHTFIGHLLHTFEFAFFSLIVMGIVFFILYLGSRKMQMIPSRLQSVVELLIGGLSDFIIEMLGKKGQKFVPFLGTILIYVLSMNLIGLIPFMKSATASWSTTLVLALCVFVYVQYTAFKELKIAGYADHLMGNLRGPIAYTLVMPLLLFMMHTLSELIKPISLSLRLRSNIWGEDMMLAMFAGFGLPGLPFLFLGMLMALLSAFVQAAVFFILSTVYFKLVMHEEEPEPIPEIKM